MNSKKIVCLLLSAALLLQTPLAASAEETQSFEQYRSGSGQTADEYELIEVSTEAELREIAANCVLDAWSRDKRIVLQNDIRIGEELSIPSFAGIFDGNGYSLTNVSITSDGSAAGLFRYVQESGSVINLSVAGKIAPGGTASRTGGIVGVNYGKIENCTFTGQITGDGEVGGIAGVNEKTGEIRRCQNNATVIGNHSVGGIVGENHGVLNNCSNRGDINTYGTEVSLNLEDLTVENMEQINSTSNVSAHTDTGGIAGISDGKIYYCSNSGTVGYQHVGYNTGGIVGRLHQGYLQNCTNTGHVLGRKDVGGIVGQMEPFLEVQYLSDKLKELDDAADLFLDMLDATYQDISDSSKAASATAKNISTYLKNANAAGKELTTTATDLWYIYNQELGGISKDLKILNDELNQAGSGSGNGNGSGSSGTVSGGDVSGNGLWDDISGNDIWNGISGNNPGNDEIESYKTALRKFGDNASKHLDTMTKASTDRTGGIKSNLEAFNNNLDGAVDSLGQLADILESATDKTNENMDALSAQARVLRRLISEIRDDLFRYEGISVEDTSDESASRGEVNPGDPGAESTADEEDPEARYDTTSFQQGKVTLCVNRGAVEADTNVGGIVGQVATEYDFDPEEDITFTGTESFDIEQTIKAVIRDCRNTGAVAGKKDCVGGIAGKAEFGAIISCESYGDIESTGGSEVGGIAGYAGYAIRSCYSMGRISGKNEVGGIVGMGCDIFYSSAYNEIEVSGEYGGAVAGNVSDDGTLYGNCYVAGSLGGVDGIGYEDGAQPLSYEEFCSREGMPEDFGRFTVTFRADGKELASFVCRYGDALDASQIPEVPKKDGFYGMWPEFDYSFITANKVLDAEYEMWISSVASEETDESGRPILMARGEFYPGAKLYVTAEDGVYRFSLTNGTAGQQDAPYEGEAVLRVLCTDPDNTVVEVEENGTYIQAETRVMGSYLEFTAAASGTFRLSESAESGRLRTILMAVGGAAVLLIIGLLTGRAVKRRKKRKSTEKAEKEKEEKGREE